MKKEFAIILVSDHFRRSFCFFIFFRSGAIILAIILFSIFFFAQPRSFCRPFWWITFLKQTVSIWVQERSETPNATQNSRLLAPSEFEFEQVRVLRLGACKLTVLVTRKPNVSSKYASNNHNNYWERSETPNTTQNPRLLAPSEFEFEQVLSIFSASSDHFAIISFLSIFSAAAIILARSFRRSFLFSFFFAPAAIILERSF